jgi:predicted nucleic acid-binding protein
MEDSRILIDSLRKEKKEKSVLWKLKEEYEQLAISSISVFELFAGATNDQKINDVKTLLKWFEIINFTDEIAEIAGEIFRQLKKENKLIEYRDLFIGSSTIFYNLKLATLNVKHFDKIPNLEIIQLP